VVTRIVRDERIPVIWFVANCGGILGLCMGFSIVTVFEVLHYLFSTSLGLLRRANPLAACCKGGDRQTAGEDGEQRPRRWRWRPGRRRCATEGNDDDIGMSSSDRSGAVPGVHGAADAEPPSRMPGQLGTFI